MVQLLVVPVIFLITLLLDLLHVMDPLVLERLWTLYLRLTLVALIPFLLQHYLLLVLVIVLHELIHALATPSVGLTDRTTVGLWLEKGMLYVHEV